MRNDDTTKLRALRVVARRFEIVAIAGQGGMGSVFRARDRVTDAFVALKVLHKANPEVEGRLRRESELLARVDHPGIVRHVADGVLVDGRPWLAMEWVEGEELRRRLLGPGVTVAETIALGRRVAEALDVLHAHGIVHRDVKPSNILLVGSDASNPRLIDLGIARSAALDPEPMTETGVVLGTVGYLAPEQARGERHIGPPADLFALGVVLYRCLSGVAPFDGPTPAATLAKILFEEPPRLRKLRPELPEALEGLVAELLAKDPAARPADGATVAARLAAISSDAASPGAGPDGGLTTDERRLACVVVARPGPGASALSAEDRDRLHAFGARVEDLADGSVVAALSGVGTAGDLAARAARCALTLRRDWEGPMALSMGRGTDGRVPFGEVIDLAWALLDRLPSRGVAVDDTTAGLLDTRFDVARVGGRNLLRRERSSAGARTLLGVATPCVGRDREIEALLGLFRAAAEGPESRVALVTAPTGVGKSRLRVELLDRLEGATVWMARGDPLRAGSPFALAADLLRGGLRAGSREELLAALRERLSADDTVEHAPFLGELLDIPFELADDPRLRAAQTDAMLMGDRMELAWEAVLAAESSRRPLVLVLEDLQWGDLPSVRWVDRALRNLDEQPILVLALGRPELHDRFPRLWAGRRVEEIRLGGLSRKAGARLVREVLAERIDDAGVDALLDRAEGNAFYLEELIRAQAAGSALPDTLLAMAQSRVESLEPDARRILRAASVFGNQTWRGGIAALLGADPGEALDAWLRVLDGRELLSPRARSALPGQAEFVFRHGLVREAAYAMLTDDDRARAHRAAATWLHGAGERAPLVLAEHCERGGALLHAAAWFGEAAAAALEGDDLAAVLAHVARAQDCRRRAAELDATGPNFDAPVVGDGQLRLLAAEAHRWRGEIKAAEAEAAVAMAELPVGSASWYRAAGERGEALGALSRADALSELAAEVRDGPIGPDADSARVIAIARIALPLLFAGRYALAEALLYRAGQEEALLRRDPLARGYVYRGFSNHATFQGDVASAIVADQRTVRAFEEAGDRRNRCRAGNSLGFANLDLGRYADAEALFRETIREAERLGIGTTAALARQNLGMARGRRGALEEGMALEERSHAELLALGNTRLAAASLLYLAFLRRLAGDPVGAIEASLAGEALLREASEPGCAFARAVRARAQLDVGDVDDAVESAEAAWEVLVRLGAIDEGEALVRLVHVQALTAAGRVREAREATIAAQERLRARALRILDPELRRSFLEDVAEHRETMALR